MLLFSLSNLTKVRFENVCYFLIEKPLLSAIGHYIPVTGETTSVLFQAKQSKHLPPKMELEAPFSTFWASFAVWTEKQFFSVSVTLMTEHPLPAPHRDDGNTLKPESVKLKMG